MKSVFQKMMKYKKISAFAIALFFFVGVLSIPLSVFAAIDRGHVTVGGSLKDKYNLQSVYDEFGAIDTGYISLKGRYTAAGYDASVLTGNTDSSSLFYNGSFAQYTNSAFLSDTYMVADTYTNMSGVTYDISNSYNINTISSYDLSATKSMQVFSLSGVPVCIVDGKYLVSSSPFAICPLYNSASSVSLNNDAIIYYNDAFIVCNNANERGLYVLDFASNNSSLIYNQKLGFTDMDIYISSSDGSTGFTSINDFEFSEENYNFNYLKTGEGGIISPADPEISPIIDNDSEHYLNIGINSAYYGADLKGFYCQMVFSLNNYVKLHPEQYKLMNRYELHIGLDGDDKVFYFQSLTPFNKISNPYSETLSFQTFEDLNDTKNAAEYACEVMTYIARNNNGWSVTMDEVASWDHLDYDLNDILYDPVAFINALGDYVTTPVQSAMPTIKPVWLDGISHISTFYISCEHTLVANDGEDLSGVFRDKYDFLGGGYEVQQNDITTNFNPLDITTGYDIITPYSGNQYSGGGGGVSVIQNSNPVITVEDDDDNKYALRDPTYVNAGENFNIITSALSGESESGFVAVIENAYTFIPDQMWHLLYVGVGAVTVLAVVDYVRRR